MTAKTAVKRTTVAETSLANLAFSLILSPLTKSTTDSKVVFNSSAQRTEHITKNRIIHSIIEKFTIEASETVAIAIIVCMRKFL